MNTLTAHLTAGTSHGRLPFHPDCPVCESQRLLGRAPTLAVPPRAQAGLLTGAIAAGALVPVGPVAASPPAAGLPDIHTIESPPAAIEDVPPTGDETTEPPRDEAPDLREVLTSPDAGTDTDGEDVAEGVEIEPPLTTPQPPPEQPLPLAPAPAAPDPPAPELPPPPPASQPAPESTAPVPSVPAPEEPEPAADHEQHEAKSDRDRGPTPNEYGVSQPAAEPVPSADPPTVVEVEPAGAPTAVVSAPASRPAGLIRGSSYTVRSGDSLWSIASRLLAPGASNGQIAKLVNRLWEHNRERIGTGDPNLLRVGTKLRLP